MRSYWRFFEAIYRDKYYYMGEADLLSAAFLLDTAQYYIFVVIPAYRVYGRFFWMPVLGPKEAFFNYKLMKFYNRRFKALAELRREMGEAGKRNAGRRIKAYFALDTAPLRMALRGVKLWLIAELDGLRLQRQEAVSRQAGGDRSTDALGCDRGPFLGVPLGEIGDSYLISEALARGPDRPVSHGCSLKKRSAPMGALGPATPRRYY